MKKFIYAIMIACSFAFVACNDDDHGRGEGSSENVDLTNLTATSRIGSVVLKWDNPTNPDYYYATVSYVNAAGETVKEKVSIYSVDKALGEGHTEVKIKGFEDTDTYEFLVTPYTSYGIAGKTESVSCAPEDQSFAYKYVAETATAEGAVEGGVISWTNEYEIPVIVTISFKNLLGKTVTETVSSAESGSKVIGAFIEPTEVSIVTSNKNNTASSEPTKVVVTPTKGEIPRTAYKCISNTGGILGGGMEEAKLFDGNWQSTWHSSTSAAGDVTMVIDLGAVYQIAMVEFVKRTDDPNAAGYPEVIKVSTSQDKSTYKDAGSLDFDASFVFNHVLRFEPVLARYVKLVISHQGNWTHLAEFVAYSHSDAVTRYADQSAAELVPDPDDDDTYYESTEYLRPMLPSDSWYNAGWYNNLKVEQTNEENPSEWTYKTTGGDSWVPLAPLQADAEGPVLVFHYKSTAGLMCEFFWCKGGFPNNLAGGRETSFNISKTTEWKTFKKDFASDWSKHGWTGKKGDGVRFDIGDGPDQTVVIRLMHWRAAD